MQLKAWQVAALCCAGTVIVLLLLGLWAGRGNTQVPSDQSTSNRVGLGIGDFAPEFKFVSTDGETIRSSDLRGRVIVLTSAAVWCPSCAVEALQLAAVYAKHRNDPVQFVTVDIDPRNSIEFINQFRKENITPWPYGQANEAAQLITDYRLNRFEITYVIDQDGIIRYHDTWITSFEELEQALKTLL
jgi:peroxiredoxin